MQNKAQLLDAAHGRYADAWMAAAEAEWQLAHGLCTFAQRNAARAEEQAAGRELMQLLQAA